MGAVPGSAGRAATRMRQIGRGRKFFASGEIDIAYHQFRERAREAWAAGSDGQGAEVPPFRVTWEELECGLR